MESTENKDMYNQLYVTESPAPVKENKKADVEIVPLGDRLIIKIKPGETKTKTGLYIPEQHVEKPQQATVVSVGPGFYERGEYIKIDVEPGDEILYQKHAGSPFKIGEEEYVILESQDVLGKLRKI